MNAPHLFLEGLARPLLLLHALVAVVLGGASTHLALVSVRMLRGNLSLGRLARVYAVVIGVSYVIAFAVGLLMYPHYRYVVRGLYLDRYEPWASNLFDIKENLAALGLPLALALAVVGARFEPAREQALVKWLAFLACAVWAVSIAAALSGFLITDVRGV